MAVHLTISDATAEWLRRVVDGKESDWHWGAGSGSGDHQRPSDNDRICVRELKAELDAAKSHDPKWEGPGSR